MKNLLLLLLFGQSICLAQTTLPIVRTDQDRIPFWMNGERSNMGNINAFPATFNYSFEVPATGMQFAIVSVKDSVPFSLKQGDVFRFRLVRELKRDTILCVFSGITKAATFSDAYVKGHEGRNFIEVPEVYELVNIVMAITPTGLSDGNLLPHKTLYYTQVLRWFEPFRTHPAVAKMDSALKLNQYSWLKMDAYAYKFKEDWLIRSDIYNRVSWGDTNTLIPYIYSLVDFARTTQFQKFYQQHLPYYNSLIADYRANINIDGMRAWLEKQFPRTRYSSVKAIFSPLVAANQSGNHFEDNGFREAQMHINFPFKDYFPDSPELRRQAQRQEIAFTELNHSYLNPEADQYKMRDYLSDVGKWTSSKTPSGYLDPYSCFCEYMNWALVTLYHSDHFSGKEFDTLRGGIDRRMVEARGFVKFKEFDAELLRLYKSRKSGQTVADLYPAILAWVAKQK